MEVDGSDSDSNNSNSPEPLSDDESVDEEKIAELQAQIEKNPYIYEQHLQIISLLRTAGDLDRLRQAREHMNKVFPLTPELWLDWLTDEEKLAVTTDEKNAVISLFERAVKDYSSVSIWLEYVQYAIGLMSDEESIQKIRKTFENALASVGIHAVQGALIWDAYREFELALLSTLQTVDCPTAEEEKKIDQQNKKICSLFRRQLSVPLLYMDKIYQEFENFSSDSIDSSLKQTYRKCIMKLEAIKPYEDALFQSEPPHLEEYKKYIKYEQAGGDPTRVQNIFERALVENCLNPSLWDEYTRYLDNVIRIEAVVLSAHERAIRNCPWSLTVWKNYALALERHNQSHDAIKGVFERAFNSGFTEGQEYLELWLAYLDYMRRRIGTDKDNADVKETQLKELITVFERANEHIFTYYKSSDPQCSILQYWAKIEAQHCKNPTRAREIWNDIMNCGHHAVAEMWINYANFERVFGDSKHYRKVLLKGLHSASDWPESIGNLLLTFEREEGTLDSLEYAIDKYTVQMQRAEERRKRIQDREEDKNILDNSALFQKQERSNKKQPNKSKGPSAENMDADGFRIPPPPLEDRSSASSHQAKKRNAEDSSEQQVKKLKVEKVTDHGATIKHDSSKDDRSVFCSNLDYSADEEKIKEMFSSVGCVEEVRLVKDFKGRSKGYCYVLFATMEAAKEALKKDRCRLDGRPVFVSHCEDKAQKATTAQPKFRYCTSLEKNKLFVKNLPFATTEKELEDIYKEFGALKEVRLVTYRNGHSKGLAYVEFNDEASAKTALVKTDGLKIGEHVISVAISHPPGRKGKEDTYAVPSLGRGSTSVGPRGKGRTQVVLLPRVVQRKPTSQGGPKAGADAVENGSQPSTSDASKSLGNEDFRQMLLKKS